MKQDQKKGDKNKVGAYGEKIAAKYLQKLGMKVLDTNYLKKWGEIDIIASEITECNEYIRFVEVKTVSYETKSKLNNAVTQETWRPEENVHYSKLMRLTRTIECWIAENNYDGEWEIDVIAIRIVPHEKFATVNYLKNIIIE